MTLEIKILKKQQRHKKKSWTTLQGKLLRLQDRVAVARQVVAIQNKKSQ